MLLSIEKINAMSAAAFTDQFADVAEHSPWVAEAAAAKRPYVTQSDMVAAFSSALDEAQQAQQLALICAHPDLAGKVTLTTDSRSEQAGAGLDTLNEQELASFTELNDSYKAKFQFPFIFAVKGATKHQILESFEIRIRNGRAMEFATALDNIKRIFSFRIEDQVE